MKIKINVSFTLLLLCILIINTTSADNTSVMPDNIQEKKQEQQYKENCKFLLNHYGININVRSQMGWQRVIRNNNLYIYTNGTPLTNRTRQVLEQCILDPNLNNRIIFDRGDQL